LLKQEKPVKGDIKIKQHKAGWNEKISAKGTGNSDAAALIQYY